MFTRVHPQLSLPLQLLFPSHLAPLSQSQHNQVPPSAMGISLPKCQFLSNQAGTRAVNHKLATECQWNKLRLCFNPHSVNRDMVMNWSIQGQDLCVCGLISTNLSLHYEFEKLHFSSSLQPFFESLVIICFHIALQMKSIGTSVSLDLYEQVCVGSLVKLLSKCTLRELLNFEKNLHFMESGSICLCSLLK